MRIVFFGSPEAALPSFEALIGRGHEVVLAVTQPDRPSGRGRRLAACPVKIFALERAIPVAQPEKIRKDPAILPHLEELRPEIQVVVAYGQIMPLSVIDLPPRGTINVHFSLLPKYRGAAPVARAIQNGEARTGVSIFRLNEAMDAGDVYATAETDIRPGETAGELEKRLSLLGAELLVRTLDGIDGLEAVAQDRFRATLAPKLRKEDGRIDWAQNAESVERSVRAMTPWPSAFTFLRGERLIVVRGQLAGPGDPSQPRGTVLSIGTSGMAVACGGGSSYLITRLQPEGRNPMDARAYVQGGKIKEGDRLE